jgi:hypothetical protein
VDVDVAVGREADGRLLVTLQTATWEINVRANEVELAKLGEIRTADWNQQRSIAAGESAEASVFWASSGDEATIMLGRDDETWDVALTVPTEVVERIAWATEKEA